MKVERPSSRAQPRSRTRVARPHDGQSSRRDQRKAQVFADPPIADGRVRRAPCVSKPHICTGQRGGASDSLVRSYANASNRGGKTAAARPPYSGWYALCVTIGRKGATIPFAIDPPRRGVGFNHSQVGRALSYQRTSVCEVPFLGLFIERTNHEN